jgi:hypothetical protein
VEISDVVVARGIVAWLLTCTNPLYVERDDANVTYGHVYQQDDERIAGLLGNRACLNCGTPVPDTYGIGARLRCYSCGLVIQPYDGMLCLQCGWPMRRAQYRKLRTEGDTDFWTKIR